MPIEPGAAPAPRPFTARSVFFGLLGLFIVAAGAGYHHTVLGRSGAWMISNHMPPVVFAYMLAVGLGWNGLLETYLPSFLFPSPVPTRQGNVLLLDKTVYQGFVSGLSQGSDWGAVGRTCG